VIRPIVRGGSWRNRRIGRARPDKTHCAQARRRPVSSKAIDHSSKRAGFVVDEAIDFSGVGGRPVSVEGNAQDHVYRSAAGMVSVLRVPGGEDKVIDRILRPTSALHRRQGRRLVSRTTNGWHRRASAAPAFQKIQLRWRKVSGFDRGHPIVGSDAVIRHTFWLFSGENGNMHFARWKV